jgi:hypothetical protein
MLPAQAPPTWHLVEELRIGSTDGPDALSRVSDLTVSADGSTLYVAQPQEHTIRVFDAVTGEPRGRIGRHGEGPGEFVFVDRMGWLADSLYATDFLLQRYSLFGPGEEHVQTEVVNPPLQEGSRRGSYPIALIDGAASISQEDLASRSLADGSVTSSPWALVSRDGAVIRNLAVRDLREIRAAIPIPAGRVHTVISPQPLSVREFIAVHPEGTSIVAIHQPAGRDAPGEYDVVRIRPDGDTVYAVTYRYRPRPLPRAYVDSIYASKKRSFGNWLPSGQAEEAARKHMIVPDAFPPLSALVMARDDSVSLRKEDMGGGSVTWLVLGEEGRVRAMAAAPADLHIRYADREAAWGVVHDELDVPYVVRLRIRR